MATAGRVAHFQLFHHGADIGIRGIGPTKAEAFAQAAIALTAAITEPRYVREMEKVSFECSSPDDVVLFVDWINALIFEMSVRKVLFARAEVQVADGKLRATAWGESVDRERHQPAAEPKGATFTQAIVAQNRDGTWTAQCVVDV
jgi:tRNA nucleotidyltransferase (CCA-adding enzyme)